MVLIKTQRDTLLVPLQSVSGIVERRHTLPILSNVLLEKRGDRLTLLATDIEIQITTSTDGAGGEGDGAITVGARKLQDILLSLSDNVDVSLLLESKNYEGKYDVLVFVDCSEATREERAMFTRGWIRGEVARRQKHQMSLDEKRAKAQEIVDNNGSMDDVEHQVKVIWQKYVKG